MQMNNNMNNINNLNLGNNIQFNQMDPRIRNMIQQNLPFEKKIVSKKEAYDFYKKKGYMEMIKTLGF